MRQVYEFPLRVQISGELLPYLNHVEAEHWQSVDHDGEELEVVFERQLREAVETLLGDVNRKLGAPKGNLVLTLGAE